MRPKGHITRVASFAGIIASQRRAPRTPLPGRFGEPIDMGRVRPAAKRRRDAPAPGLAPRRYAPAIGLAPLALPATLAAAGDRQTIPPVVAGYVALLERELADLATLAAAGIKQPPL